MSHNKISSGEYHNVRNIAPSTQCTSLTFILFSSLAKTLLKKNIFVLTLCEQD